MKALIQFLVILGESANLLNSYPLLYQPDANGYNGFNLNSGYQGIPQNQMLKLANNINPLYYNSLLGFPNAFSQRVKILGVGDGVTDLLPTTVIPTTPVTDPTGVIGGTGLPVTSPISGPASSLLPCLSSGLIGNILQSSLCCSLIGALSPCSLLGLGNVLSNVGVLGGGLVPNVGGVSSLPFPYSLLLSNLIPNVGSLPGVGGCACGGLNAQLPLPQLPNPSCCPTINLSILPTILPIPIPATIPAQTPVIPVGGPVTDPTTPTVPITDPAAPITDPITDPTDPVIDPTTPTVPITNPTAPVTDPVISVLPKLSQVSEKNLVDALRAALGKNVIIPN